MSRGNYRAMSDAYVPFFDNFVSISLHTHRYLLRHAKGEKKSFFDKWFSNI